MESATFLFSAFVIYLYLPHIFFKFWAENSIDLGRRRDASQLEEFISAALPSALLNIFAQESFISDSRVSPLCRRLIGSS